MTNSRFNRTLRTGIPILFGMLLVVNCVSEGGSGSGCASPVAPTQTQNSSSQNWVITGTVVEYRDSVETRVPDVTVRLKISGPHTQTSRNKTDINGEYRLEFYLRRGTVEVRPTKEGYTFSPLKPQQQHSKDFVVIK